MRTISFLALKFHANRVRLAVLAAAVVMGVASCYQGVQPDPTPPHVYVLKWERATNGSQASQSTVESGGSFAVSGSWLGPNQANIRVYGDAPHGVRKLTVSGTATGTCSSRVTSGAFMAFDLDGTVLLDRSCGMHSYNGAPPNLEYFLDAPATWTITGVAENGSGLLTTGNFHINVQ
jgi:hypothetical protein